MQSPRNEQVLLQCRVVLLTRCGLGFQYSIQRAKLATLPKWD
jgi:hypothetical protein